jgi:ribonucleoside-diphosphate reductase alpha chain
MDAFSISISVGLQYGIPLESYVQKFTNMRFEPAGMTDDPDIRIASSVMDYIFRRLALDHLPYQHRAELGILSAAERAAQLAGQDPATLGEDPDPLEMAQSAPVETNLSTERSVPTLQPSPAPAAKPASSAAAPATSKETGAPHSTAELIEAQQGRTADAPLCLTCGTKMRPAGSCYVCEGCGSTSGCS